MTTTAHAHTTKPAHQQGARLGAAARCSVVLIEAYQRWISPMRPRTCRYYPSCSAYGIEAITTHGLVKGLLLAAWRIVRCNPFTRGGVDHVPEAGQWRYHYPKDQARPLPSEADPQPT